MDAVSRRLLKELRDYQKDPNPQVAELSPTADDDLLAWHAVILGQKDTIYEGWFYGVTVDTVQRISLQLLTKDGRFDLDIKIPNSYPMQPPIIKFVGNVCHPNVHFKTGEICLDLLKSAWSPAWTLQSACVAIGVLLTVSLTPLRAGGRASEG